jgi:succinate dehydrogenase/fumarate reductase flavoprotein subunit
MKTTVKGLYVIGADNANGSAIHGSAPLPAGQRGGSFMHCVVTGSIAGTNAADEVKAIDPHADIPADLISELKEQAYVSLNRKNGIDVRTMLTRVQNVACPINIMLRKSEQSLTRAIGQMNEIKADLTKLVAKDYHELKLCNEVEAMALTTEIMIKSALARTESRDFHFREDYPKIDNKHWLKWVLANNVNGDVVISTEDVPIKDYPYQPADL